MSHQFLITLAGDSTSGTKEIDMRESYPFWAAFTLQCVLLAHPSLAASVSDFNDFSLAGTPSALPGRLYVPPAALSDPLSPRPLILFLHGGGEYGTNNISQVNINIDNLLAEAKRRGAYLYAPQSAYSWDLPFVTDNVMKMVDRAIAEQNVDRRRIYITGISDGGGGAWDMMSRHSNRFAAGVPIEALYPNSFEPAKLVHESIWDFQSRNDGGVFTVDNSRSLINSILIAAVLPRPTYPDPIFDPPLDFAFSSTSPDLRYTEYASGGHAIWPRVYSTAAMYDWLFSHVLPVPEPGSLLLAGVAFVGLSAARRGSSTTNAGDNSEDFDWQARD
jgi:predicted peptidase